MHVLLQINSFQSLFKLTRTSIKFSKRKYFYCIFQKDLFKWNKCQGNTKKGQNLFLKIRHLVRVFKTKYSYLILLFSCQLPINSIHEFDKKMKFVYFNFLFLFRQAVVTHKNIIFENKIRKKFKKQQSS